MRLELDALLSESLRTGGFDVVFPVVHGAVGEDGALQGLLEVLDLPYVGSGVLASALAMHKRVARVLFERAGAARRARESPLRRGDATRRGASAARSRGRGARLVVKPSSHGSAIGVDAPRGDARSTRTWPRRSRRVWALDDVAIVEHFARGREVTCGVLDARAAAEALPPTEILSPNDPFYTYEARYAPGAASTSAPPSCRPPSSRACRRSPSPPTSRSAAAICRASTSSWATRATPDRRHLLEVNTLPGMTATSLYPEAAGATGSAMPALCDALVATARPQARPHARASRPPSSAVAGTEPTQAPLASPTVKRAEASGHPAPRGPLLTQRKRV